MPWFVLFCFLTAPIPIGVAFTVAIPAFNHRSYSPLVFAAAVVWVVFARIVQLIVRRPVGRVWIVKWFALAVVLPLVGLFVVQLAHAPEVTGTVTRHLDANEKSRTDYDAVTAPGTYTPTTDQSWELLAQVQPQLVRYLLQLLKSLPPVWWLVAFALSAWKGK